MGIFFLILLFNFFKINPFGSITQKVSYPIIKTGSVISSPFGGISGYFSSKKGLEKKIISLEEELDKNKVQILENQFLRDENKTLKEYFGRDEGEDIGVLGMIIKRPPFSPYDTFVIDLNNKKVSIGQTVYISKVPVGEIIETSSSNSIVKLFSSSGTTRQVMISGNIEVEAIGNGGGRFTSTIPKDLEVKEGDTVTYINDKQHIFAIVESVLIDDTKTLSVVRFNFPFSLNTIRFVEVK